VSGGLGKPADLGEPNRQFLQDRVRVVDMSDFIREWDPEAFHRRVLELEKKRRVTSGSVKPTA
jgi:hypothetical protein